MPDSAANAAGDLEPTRFAGLSRLVKFVPNAGRAYAKARNFDFGPDKRHNVSMLSPYIRHRLVQEPEVLAAVLNHHGRGAAAKFVDEVFWRSYFKGWLEHRPSVWASYRQDVGRLIAELDADPGLRDRYDSAVAGQTGIDCFDSWSAELVTTGYLHNHARMWFASIWVFTLQLPWQLGADFFYRNLRDGDPASNTLGWRWVSGLHTKGKTYLARVSNIANYTDNRFNPDKQLASHAPPLEETAEHPVRELREPARPTDISRYGLLVTEEDCSPTSLALPGRPCGILGAVATELRSPLAVGKPARSFALGAVVDAVERTSEHFDAPGAMAPTDDWARELGRWAADNDIDTIVTSYAPVGPVAETLERARRFLADRNVRVVEVRREYDALCWPHASKGYYKLKARIPDILDAIAPRETIVSASRAVG